MCSTFKFLAAALVLSRLDQGQKLLNRRIAAQASDIVPYSPATLPRVGGVPMTVAELCEAALTLSDNAAGNLLLKASGSPRARRLVRADWATSSPASTASSPT